MRLIFDIETDGLLDKVSQIHSLVIKDLDKQKLYSCSDHTGYLSIKSGLELLGKASVLIGHNIMSYDIPVLKKLFPSWDYIGDIKDTLIISRLIWPEIKEKDYSFIKRYGKEAMPSKLINRHSLEAWGYRLRVYKGEFGKATDWASWSEEMQGYCEQDVTVTEALWNLIESKNYSEIAIQLEHDFRSIILKQEHFGFPFDIKEAQKLYGQLSKRRQEIEEELQEAFPPKTIKLPFIPKANNKKRGYVKGVKTYKEKTIVFNPASRQQIGERLIEKYGWKPKELTNTGIPKVDETILSKLHYPEATLLSEYLLVNKRIGQLAEGKNAWLKLERNGRIHGEVITNGTVTGRCAHRNPNVAQVPASHSPYGKECRALFHAPEGWVQVGCDASGLELRCLAHYMARYDDGKYAKLLLEGDIHTENQKAAGLPTRDSAKTFIYAFLYGAGNVKLGSIVAPQASTRQQNTAGARLKAKFFSKVPALKMLQDDVQRVAKKRKYLIGLDGRQLHIRSLHSALNTLLQSAGSIVMKKATCILWEKLTEEGHIFGEDIAQVAHVHDEYQLVCRPELAAHVGELGVLAIREAGAFFKFRCPLDGEFKVGKNWEETH